jgi:hypothetical protein
VHSIEFCAQPGYFSARKSPARSVCAAHASGAAGGVSFEMGAGEVAALIGAQHESTTQYFRSGSII